jgi:hypothetical protein
MYMGFLGVFYQNKMLMKYRIMCSFYGKFVLKNVSFLDSIIVLTNMSVTPEFIIKNLYRCFYFFVLASLLGPTHDGSSPAPQFLALHTRDSDTGGKSPICLSIPSSC